MGSYHWPPHYFFYLGLYLKLFRIKTIPSDREELHKHKDPSLMLGRASGTPATLALVGKGDGTMGS